ncbi:hypothetical protein MMC20_006778 [Loxospora ochrophaea]|nr:hypothetical protein [Loxospora ochrophaea]
MNSQFSLSLELSRVLPPAAGYLASASGSAVLRLARELSASGSDIIVEEDLVHILGKVRIRPEFESTFKAVMKTHSVSPFHALAEIVLEAGAGPTVRRALQHKDYLATVIQLSLLHFVYDRELLAASLHEAIRRRNAAHETDRQNTTPPTDKISAALKACFEQTSLFKWDLLIRTVEQHLKRVESVVDTRYFPTEMLQGALDVFYITQSLPEDRSILVKTNTGIASLVVWAHHLLGLTVRIHRSLTLDSQDVDFGLGQPQLVVSSRRNTLGYTVCLLNEEQEHITKLTQDPRNEVVQLRTVPKYTVKGYGIMSMNDVYYIADAEKTVYQDIMPVATGTAINIGAAITRLPVRATEVAPRNNVPCSMLQSAPQRILTAARCLFHPFEINENRVLEWAKENERTAWRDVAYLSALKEWSKSNALDRPRFRSLGLCLVQVCLAFAVVGNLKECEDALLGSLLVLQQQAHQLQKWDGEQTVDIDYNTWFETIARLLCFNVGPEFDQELLGTSLISNLGWSLMRGSISDEDPAMVSPESLCLCHGVPSRRGERRERIKMGLEVLGFSKDRRL